MTRRSKNSKMLPPRIDPKTKVLSGFRVSRLLAETIQQRHRRRRFFRLDQNFQVHLLQQDDESGIFVGKSRLQYGDGVLEMSR